MPKENELINKDQFLNLLQVFNLSIDKFKDIQQDVEELKAVFYGNPFKQIDSFYNKFSVVENKVNGLNNFLDDKIRPEIELFKNHIKDQKYEADQVNQKLIKLQDTDKRLEKLEDAILDINDFILKIKNWPRNLMIYIPLVTLAFNVVLYYYGK